MNPRRESNAKTNGKPSPSVRANLRVVRAVSYADLDDSTIVDMVRLVTGYGAALMLAVTSDGGSFSVCVLDNTNKIKEYPHTKEEVELLYQWLRDDYFGDGGKPVA